MRNNKMRLFASLIILVLAFAASGSYGQQTRSYDLRFLKAIFIDTSAEKDILVLFHISAKEEKDFPPVLSMKATYSIGENGEDKVLYIGQGDNKARITIYGNNIKEKNFAIYSLIEDKIDITTKTPFMVLAFYLNDISPQMFDKMSFTYGLWEKNDQKVRIEEKYQFAVGQ